MKLKVDVVEKVNIKVIKFNIKTHFSDYRINLFSFNQKTKIDAKKKKIDLQIFLCQNQIWAKKGEIF